MSRQPPPEEERFRYEAAPPAYQSAVDQLSLDSGKTRIEFEQLTPSQIYHVAREYYGSELPEFWRVWRDWNEFDEIQPMGDL